LANRSLDEIIEAQQTRLKLRVDKPPEKMTNIDRVHHMMNFSDHAALAQVFIIEAIRHYSATVRANEPPEDPDDHAFITKRKWWEISVDVNKEINQHLNIKEE
jgi:hypothetical protein